jgi:hypothetical protein
VTLGGGGVKVVKVVAARVSGRSGLCDAAGLASPIASAIGRSVSTAARPTSEPATSGATKSTGSLFTRPRVRFSAPGGRHVGEKDL